MSSLKKLAIEKIGVMPVKDAKGNPVVDEATGQAWTITHHSPGTKEFQAAKHAFDTKRSDSTIALMTGKTVKRSADDDTADRADFLAAITISFDGFDYEGRIGHAAYKAAYSDLEIGHVANDFERFIGERGNYSKAAPAASNAMSDSQPG